MLTGLSKIISTSNFTRNTLENRDIWAYELKKALSLSKMPMVKAIRGFFWPIGTHYFKPLCGSQETRESFLQRAQNPYTNVKVCGEVVALNQGWTNEALKTVYSIL